MNIETDETRAVVDREYFKDVGCSCSSITCGCIPHMLDGADLKGDETGMIEGLRIDVSSEEMKKMLEGRMSFHSEKAGMYGSQLEALEDEPTVDMTADPKKALRDRLRHHQNRWEFFRFLAEHVIPNETYRLAETDLVRLEILSRGW